LSAVPDRRLHRWTVDNGRHQTTRQVFLSKNDNDNMKMLDEEYLAMMLMETEAAAVHGLQNL
jgi:hypothetical protein